MKPYVILLSSDNCRLAFGGGPRQECASRMVFVKNKGLNIEVHISMLSTQAQQLLLLLLCPACCAA